MTIEIWSSPVSWVCPHRDILSCGGGEVGMALAVPFSLLLPLPLQSGSGNPRREALVSQTIVFLQDGWCLAPLQAPGLPSPSPVFSRHIHKGGLFSDRPHARNAAAQPPHSPCPR